MDIKCLPWVEKYRPKNMKDIISHNNILNTLTKIIKQGSLPHLLFNGTPGTGKTSTILTIAKKLYGNDFKFMVLELNASDDRGINSVRIDIKGFAEAKTMFTKGIKLIILDEADSMTCDAQFALRRIIEEHSNTVRFCLICNYINKIIPAIRSRCMIFRFLPIPIKDSFDILQKICKKENIKYDKKTLLSIIKVSNGDLRSSINLLQSISLQYDTLIKLSAYKIISTPEPNQCKKMLFMLMNDEYNFNYCEKKITKLINKNNYSIDAIITQLYNVIIENINDISDDRLSKYIIDLAELEYLLNSSSYSDIYIGALINIFKS